MRNLLLTSMILFASPALAEKVTVTGCPVQGVESGCLILNGDNGKSYNITSANPKPKIGGKAIKLTGDVSDKMSFCQQSATLENIKFEETTKNCDAAGAK